MSTDRAVTRTLVVFALSLAGVGLAAMSAWLRCDGPGDCSSELALSIVALAPAALILALMLLLLLARTASVHARRVILIVIFGVGSTPLTAFLLREPWVIAVFALLLSIGVGIALYGDVGKPSEELADAAPATREPPDKPRPSRRNGTAPALTTSHTSGRQPIATSAGYRPLATTEALSGLVLRLQAADRLMVTIIDQIDALIAQTASTDGTRATPSGTRPERSRMKSASYARDDALRNPEANT